MGDNKSFSEFQYLVKNCKVCDGKGFIFSMEKENNLLIPSSNKARKCDCIKKAYRYSLFQDANIPREYYDLSVEKDFISDSHMKNYVKLVKENIIEFHESG